MVKQTVNNQDEYTLTLNPQPVISVTQLDGTKITTAAADISIFVIEESDVLSAYSNLGLAIGAANPGLNSIL